MKYVTAAAGRRDNYQVPIALVETGLLARHVTDAYAPDFLVPMLEVCGSFGEKVLRRHHSQLPSRLVHPSRRLAIRKALSAIPPLRNRFCGDQDPISWSALAQAQRHDAGLMLYAGYGYKAFTAEQKSARRRILVQYHPHIRDSAAILRDDVKRYPFLNAAVEQLKRDEMDKTNLPEMEIADLIVCNSSFTAATCESLGIDPQKLVVIPYGIDPSPPLESEQGRASKCSFLFVGSGVHRKGLHHLLLAWKQAALKSSTLTIVSRWIDPDIRKAIDPGPGVIWKTSVDNDELDRLYWDSSVFVLPSLIEGFGYVYLEAMSRGCFCIGTSNTGLPDIGSERSRRIFPAASVDALASSLKEAEDLYFTGKLIRCQIMKDTLSLDWNSYRASISNSVLSLES